MVALFWFMVILMIGLPILAFACLGVFYLLALFIQLVNKVFPVQ